MTTSDRFERVRQLFVEASKQPLESRRAWLDEHCDRDAALVREIEELLAISSAVEHASEEPRS